MKEVVKMAEVIPRSQLAIGLEAWLEDRKTGKIQRVRIIAQGTKGYHMEYLDSDAPYAIRQTSRYHDDYNRLREYGWRLWTEKPPQGMRAMWEV